MVDLWRLWRSNTGNFTFENIYMMGTKKIMNYHIKACRTVKSISLLGTDGKEEISHFRPYCLRKGRELMHLSLVNDIWGFLFDFLH